MNVFPARIRTGGRADNCTMRSNPLQVACACAALVVVAVRAWAVQPVAEPKITQRDGVKSKAFEPIEPPPLANSVQRLLDQTYLSDAERRAIRMKHGQWEDADLAIPAVRAQASLTRGALDDASLKDDSVPAILRAEGAVRRGEFDDALRLLGDDKTMRATRLRAQALLGQGKRDQADATLDNAVKVMKGDRLTDAEELVDGVRCLMLRARIRGPEGSDGGDFKAMMSLLQYAREQLDKFCWSASLVEAELLWEKDNGNDAGEALETVLSLNPKCADAWRMYGEMSVGGLDAVRAFQVAVKLESLATGKDEAAFETLETPAAAMVLAWMRLRENDSSLAESLLAIPAAKYPHMTDLLAWQGAAAAAGYDFDRADAFLKRLDELSPGTSEGYFRTGMILSGARQYDEASRYLREAVKRAPNWPEPIIELGLLEMQSGRDKEALEALEAAAKLDSFNIRAANSLVLVRELRTFANIESDHFVVRYKPGQDEVMAKEMLDPLERSFRRVTGNGPGGIDHVPTKKTVIELMPDHRWFSVRITGMPKLHTIAAATGPVVAMEAPREGPGHMAGPYDWRRVVQHEYTHTVTLSRTKNRLPHWFTEASAVYLEDAPRDYSTVQLLYGAFREDELFDFEKINIAFARPEKPTDRALAYAQGHWMYEYIVERWGRKAPLDLMDLYATGVREPEAFQKILGLSRDQFATDFKAWARTQLIAWGMMLPEGTPSEKEIIRELRGGAKPNAGDEKPDDDDKDPTLDEIERALATHPDHPELLRDAVRLNLDAKKNAVDGSLAALLERYAKARPVDPLPHKVLAKHLLARASEGGTSENGTVGAEAIPHLEYLDIREQHTPEYAIELATQYAAMKDWTKASAKADRAVGISPYDASIREFAAKIALQQGDVTTAERHIWALTVLEPDRAIHTQRLDAVRTMKAKQRRDP